MLYNPRKALLQILPIRTFIRIWASNQDPRFRTLSKGLMRVSPIIIDSIDVFSSCWRVPIIRNSVFASLIIKRLAINQERTSAMHISIAETALISEWILVHRNKLDEYLPQRNATHGVRQQIQKGN